MRGSFPAPHHHDPNKTLPNFQIWVMVVFLSPKHRRRATARSTLPSRRGAAALSTQSRRCGVPATGCCGTGPCFDQSSDGITDYQGQAGLSWRRLAVAKLEVASARQPLHFCSVQVEFLVALWPLGCPVRLQPGVNCLWPAQRSITRCR